MAYREKGRSWGNGLPGEGQFLGNGLTRGSGPTKRDFRSTGMFSLWKWSTDRRVGPEERAMGNMEVPGERAAEGGGPYTVFSVER